MIGHEIERPLHLSLEKCDYTGVPVRVEVGASTLLVALLLGFAANAQAADSAAPGLDHFEKKIRPLLAQHCYQCHSERAATIFGELRLDSAEAVEQGGRSGPVLVPGAPESSRLILAVRHEPGQIAMPPDGKLSDSQINALAEWVRIGAPWPQREQSELAIAAQGAEATSTHWAWQPLKENDPPSVGGAEWPKGHIDRFVLAKLDESGLAPVGAADRHTLMRRLALDLTGLPPSPERVREIEALDEESWPRFLESAVDGYLASPAFGERWGRHWLDLAGYADTLGLGRRIPAQHAWRYRDYVIDAFNRDKPYDRFVREQVAGDVLEAESDAQRREQIVATGFLAIGPWALVDQDKLQLQMDIVDNQLDTLGRAILGVTVGCARCHDHKFDPVPQRDYYALAGIFRSTRTLDARMSGVFSDVHRVRLPETAQELRSRAAALERWKRDYAAALSEQRDAQSLVAELDAEVKGAADDKDRSGDLGELKQRLTQARRAANTAKTEALRILHYSKPSPPIAQALADEPEPENAHISLGGNPHSLGAEVPRGFLSLVPLPANPKIANRRLIGIGFQKSSGRLELASWLTDSGNPLTARVIANRIWHHLFGRGIVSSVDNFGLLGERPSHPDLLDYLALRLQNLNWSTKALIREIVLSRTYGLAAEHEHLAASKDPENLLLWRSNRRRLEAETIRDSVLAVSGSLDYRSGGPSLPLESRGSVSMGQPPALTRTMELTDSIRFRRTVYLPMLRKSQLSEVDVLNLFDFPDPNTVKGNRDVTTVPTQALYLMNSPFLIKQSRAVARAMLEKGGVSDEDRVRDFVLRALGRPASSKDIARAVSFLSDTEAELGRDEAWARYCHAIFASNEFLFRG